MTIINNQETVTKEDSVLEYTQQKRRQLVEAIVKEGKMPDDIKERMTLLSALDGMDRAALGIKKIKVEDKAAVASAGLQSALADILNKVGPKTLDNPGVRTSVPSLGSEIVAAPFVAGEMAIGTQSGGYEDFMAAMGDKGIELDNDFDPEKR